MYDSLSAADDSLRSVHLFQSDYRFASADKPCKFKANFLHTVDLVFLCCVPSFAIIILRCAEQCTRKG